MIQSCIRTSDTIIKENKLIIERLKQLSKSIKSLSELSNEFVEIGPKKVLSNIIKKIDDSLTITTYNSIENL